MQLRSAAFLFSAALALGAAPRPRLVVMISVDQCSADLLQRWGGELPGGLGRLQKEGVHFTRAYHAHAFTETGPGHSVLLTGRHPAHTGITENRWLDRASGKRVYCVEDPATRTWGRAEGAGSSPANLKGSTLAGWLKAQVPGSRVFSVAGKDRAAILMAGAKADGVYWFENGVGFTTSSAYAPARPAWLERHDQQLLERLRSDAFWWTPLGGREDPARTGRWNLSGTLVTGSLPRLVNGAGMGWDAGFWERWRASPFFDAAVFDAAEALVAEEKLGQGPATDLLILGLSATDYVGHTFGNAGEEMLDQLRRLDRRLGTFLDQLRRRDPEAWVVLSADHGAADFPERLAEQGLPAKRLDTKAWMEDLREHLRARFKVEGDPLRPGSSPGQLYLNDRVLGAVGATRAEMLKAVAGVVKGLPEVAEVMTAPELESLKVDPTKAPEALSLPERLVLSYVPQRSGDLLVAFQPLRTWGSPPEELSVAGHGSPYDYDRRVPLIFLGPWKAERRTEPVRTVDLAATLAEQLGLRPSEPIDGRALGLRPAK